MDSFFPPPRPDRLRPIQPPIKLVPRGLPAIEKRPGSVADHSPPSDAEAKDAWNYTSTPTYIFMAWCLIKHRLCSWRGAYLSTETNLPYLLPYVFMARYLVKHRDSFKLY